MSLTNFIYVYFFNLVLLMLALPFVLRPTALRPMEQRCGLGINLLAGGIWIYLITQAAQQATVYALPPAASKFLLVVASGNLLFLLYNGGTTALALKRAVLANFLLGANLFLFGAQNIILAFLALAMVSLLTYFLLLLGQKAALMKFLWRFFVLDQLANIFILLGLMILAKMGLGLQLPTAFSEIPWPTDGSLKPLATLSVSFLLLGLIFKLGPLPFSGSWMDIVAHFKAEAVIVFLLLGTLPVAYILLCFICLILPFTSLAQTWWPDIFYAGTGIMMAVYNLWAWQNKDFAQSCIQGLLALAALFLIFVPLAQKINLESYLGLYMIYYILVASGVLAILPYLQNRTTMTATGGPSSAARSLAHPLQGLFYRDLGIAIYVLVVWGSVIGLPFTFGLPVKYVLHMAIFAQGHVGGMICLLVGAMTTAAFWGHQLTYLFQPIPEIPAKEKIGWHMRHVLGLGLVVGLLCLGFYPSLMMAYF